MKKLIYLMLALLNGLTSYSQNISLYEKPFKNNSMNYYGISGINGKFLYLTADTGTLKMSSLMVYPNKPRTGFVYLEGASKIKIDANIPKDSLKYFRYSVVQDDHIYLAKDLIPKPIEKGKGYYWANFGIYNVLNKKISILTYEVGKKESTTETIIYCEMLKPVTIVEAKLIEIFKDERVKKLKKNDKGDTILIEREISQGRNLNINGGLVSMNEDYSYVQISIKPIDNIFLYKVLIKRVNENNLDITLVDDLNWGYDSYTNLSCQLDIKNFKKPGKYEIIIYPKIGNIDASKPENSTKIKFELVQSGGVMIKQLIIYGIILCAILGAIFGAIIIFIKRKNKKKLLAEQQQKEIAKAQLNAVRSQLNPHFMFNALAGIQSLMNEKKTDEANQYLSKFARLTRNVLDNKELISLAEEKMLLNDYLQMEQLRFGFNYQINIQPDVDLNIEIPTMLLQPFVENAVKHGVAEKGKSGEIIISFAKREKDLLLSVNDNGNGFDTTKTYDGLGLPLSKNRIELLNSMYKETALALIIEAAEKGTTITITLNQWL